MNRGRRQTVQVRGFVAAATAVAAGLVLLRMSRRSVLLRMSIVSLGAFASFSFADDVEADASDEPAIVDPDQLNLGFGDADESVVLDLVRRLGHYDYNEREAATKALTDLGPRAFRTLAKTFAESREYEVRVRIRQIVRDQYLWHTLFKHNGFLGIQFNPVGYLVKDPRLPAPVLAIPVTTVVAGLPAERAGLAGGDLIVAVDGVYLTDDAERPDFPELITSRGAGAKLRFTIFRGNRELELEATLVARPVENYTDQQSELGEKLRAQLQAFSLWWSRHFSTEPDEPPDRAPSTVIFNLPD